MSVQLLEAIRGRRQKKTPFCYGILTADLYVKTIQDCLGLDACYRFASRGKTSFNDVMEKASKTLVYSNPEMLLEEKHTGDMKRFRLPKDTELPKNTLMVFRHVLSTSTKDRDGDVLHSDGAIVDPKMLLLWQHVHTLPIGKMLAEYEKDADRLVLISAIVDMNELCHDAAVMVDNDMGRFSHGFRALKFTETKDGEDEKGASSFDIKEWEVLEESLVSVPSNPEASTEEVMLSLVEGGKLTSPLMKEFGKSLRLNRPVQLPVTWREKLDGYEREVVGPVTELKIMAEAGLIGGNGENKSRSGSTKAKGQGQGGGASGTPKETDEGGDETKKEGADEKVIEGLEYKGYYQLDGSWEDIKHKLEVLAENSLIKEKGLEYVYLIGTYSDHFIACYSKSGDDTYYRFQWDMKDGEPSIVSGPEVVKIHTSVSLPYKNFIGRKLGRVLSKANENKISDARGDIDQAIKTDEIRSRNALLGQASRGLGDVLSSLGEAESGGTKGPTVKEAMATILAESTETDKRILKSQLEAFELRKTTDEQTKEFVEIVG